MSRMLASLALVGLSSIATADDALDETADDGNTVIVYQPDGTPRVAGSAHVIGEDELEAFEYDDIGRVLSQTPGVYIRGEDGYGLRPNIGMRGANSDRSAKVTLLEDGVPLVPAPYAAPAAYYFPMSMRVTGVEVFKGPAATQHGPQTVGGAVNLLTRPVPEEMEGTVDLAVGLRETARLHAHVGNGSARGGWLAEVAHLQTGGFKELDGGGDTGFSRTDVLLKGRLATDPSSTTRHAVELKLGWGHERSNETYLGLHVDDYEENPYRRYAASSLALMRWNRTQAELSHQLDVGAFRLRTVAYHHFLDRSWEKLNGFVGGPDLHALLQQPVGGTSEVFLDILRGKEDSVTAGQALRIGTNARRFHSFGVQSTATWRKRTDTFDSQFEAGVRVHGDLVDRLHTESPYAMTSGELVLDGPLATTLDSHATAVAVAVHAHEDLAFGGLHLLPGIRSETVRTTYDRGDGAPTEALRTTLLPGFAALQEVGDRTQLFAGVHRGFSPVAPGQDPSVRPESGVNTEVGVRTGDEYLHAEVVGYFNRYTNLTGQCTLSGGCTDDQIDQQFNGGRAWVYGLEAVGGADVFLPGRLRLPVSFTYTLSQSSFRTGFVSGFPQFGTVSIGDALPYVPVHQGGVRVGLEHDRFRLSVGASARSGMRDEAGAGPLDETAIPAQALVDVAAHGKLSERLSGYVTVVNLTNTTVMESWRPFGARPTSPRQVMVGIEVDAGRRP